MNCLTQEKLTRAGAGVNCGKCGYKNVTTAMPAVTDSTGVHFNPNL